MANHEARDPWSFPGRERRPVTHGGVDEVADEFSALAQEFSEEVDSTDQVGYAGIGPDRRPGDSLESEVF